MDNHTPPEETADKHGIDLTDSERRAMYSIPIRPTLRPAITENCANLMLQTSRSRSVIYQQRIDTMVRGRCACGDKPVLKSEYNGRVSYCLICPVCGGDWERVRTVGTVNE